MRILVCDAGGTRGAFTAGVIQKLDESGFNYQYFDEFVGSSAGACNIAYFLADQVKDGMKFWTEHLPKKFIKFQKFVPYADLEYLEKAMREIEPLDCKTIAKRKQKAWVALSNLSSLKTDFLCLNSAADPIKTLLASVAMPVFTKPVKIGENFYADGSLTAQPPLNFSALKQADEIWILMAYPPGVRFNNYLWKTLSRFTVSHPGLKQLLKTKISFESKISELRKQGKKIVVIRPGKRLPVNWRGSNLRQTRQAITLGHRATEAALMDLEKKC